VALTDLASFRSTRGMRRSFRKDLGETLVAKGPGHGSVEAVSYVGGVGAVG